MRIPCNECGNEMNTGRCDKCCMLCQEGQLVRENRLKEEMKQRGKRFEQRTALLRKQNEAYAREAAKIHTLAIKPSSFCVENGALILDPPRPGDKHPVTDIETDEK